MKNLKRTWGLLAEFDSTEQLIHAAERVRDAGYRHTEAYTPFPVHGLFEALGFHKTRVSLIVLVCGVIGACGGFFMEWYANVISFPLNIGGKPHNSWPAFIPIMFEVGVLCAAFGALLGMLIMNGLPAPYHPLFNVPGFQLASRNRFFLCIEAKDPKFDDVETLAFMESLDPLSIAEVPP